jgi:outer membrane protein OmpA-like peptidoglycan-associated protein
MVLLLALLPSALAEGWSADIELVRPTFGSGAVAGVDSAIAPQKRGLRIGLFSQYEKNPLVLVADDGQTGAIVGQRFAFDLGMSVDATDDLTIRLVLPGAVQWGSEVDAWAADTGGLRDASLGVTYRAFEAGPISLAGRADLAVPTGTRAAWLGERTPRLGFGGVASAEAGPLLASLDIGMTARERIETENDFTLGSELVGGASVRMDVIPAVLDLVGAVHTRGGFANFFGGGAENPVEVLGGLQARAGESLRIDLLAGRGAGVGYGTTDTRVALGVTWERILPGQEPEVVEREVIPEDDLEDAPDVAEVEDKEFEFEKEPEPPPKPEGIQWKEDELARQIGQRIVIRDPIRFAVGTERVLDESIPTLEVVASLLQSGDLLVIEGHASDEGSHASNYALSVRRAQSIAEEMEKLGVPPNRLSWRGLGETEPAAAGATEEERAQSRRVVFYVVRLEGEAPPTPAEVTLPWSGKTVPVRATAPSTPETPPAPATPEAPPPTPEPAPSPEPAPAPAPEENR